MVISIYLFSLSFVVFNVLEPAVFESAGFCFKAKGNRVGFLSASLS